MKIYTYIHTAFLLGLPSVARAIRYRIGLRLGLNPAKKLRETVTTGPYFGAPSDTDPDLDPPNLWHNEARVFGYLPIPISDVPPNWHINVLTGKSVERPERPWWQIPDFDSQVGDIKGIWELSRFDWAIAYAQQAASGNIAAYNRLNNWLEDWSRKNPPYLGPNWKCGQEASIRVMHLAMAAIILNQFREPLPQLQNLILQHLKRIAPTITYAIAQDNNHGTSEAAALFIGGSWLKLCGIHAGHCWEKLGRRWLENRAKQLIENDGSFSQYSTNYHRVMLDTYSMVEIWRRKLGLPLFSRALYTKIRAAIHWLNQMIVSDNGDVPNIGANDGARLLPISETDYRDYRPSVFLASQLYSDTPLPSSYRPTTNPLQWFKIVTHTSVLYNEQTEPITIYENGGYAVLRNKNASAIIRFPRFRFRPSHADCLHVDFWLQGENIFRDGGSYSYNCTSFFENYFPSNRSHNTIQFDDRDQMPRLGRFLFARWIRNSKIFHEQTSCGTVVFSAEYQDPWGVRHSRSVRLGKNTLVVEDDVRNFKRNAILRWRLPPDRRWIQDGSQFTDGSHRISITTTTEPASVLISEGWESRYYFLKSKIPVIEVKIIEPCRITTTYSW